LHDDLVIAARHHSDVTLMQTLSDKCRTCWELLW